MKLERLPSNNCKSAATVPSRRRTRPRRTRREYEENTNETRTKYERIPQAPRLLPACKSHAGGFDVAWVWLWVALLHVSAFFLLPSSFAPVWLWGGFGSLSAFILLPSSFAPVNTQLQLGVDQAKGSSTASAVFHSGGSDRPGGENR
jgi:hypothetical protein